MRPPCSRCFSVSPDSEDEKPARKTKKSPKEKPTTRKTEAPPKSDPVQYVSETGNGVVLPHAADLSALAVQHDLTSPS